MKHADYLLIGGGLASARAAQAIRERDKRGRIILVTDEDHLPYDRPPLSKEFLQGRVRSRDIRSATRFFYLKNRIRLVKGTTVTALDLSEEQNRAQLSNGREIVFGKALLATGGTPRILPIFPRSHAAVHYLRTIDDARAIRAAAAASNKADSGAGSAASQSAVPATRALVVGAGFIGLEIAASLTSLGVEVTLVEREGQVWPAFAPVPVADIVEEHLRGHGVTLLLGDSPVAMEPSDAGGTVRITLASGDQIECNLVCVAVGIEPNVDLARHAGLRVDDGVVTDTRLRTSHADVYAAGDIVRVPDPISGELRRVEHYGQAETTGALAGRNMTGLSEEYALITYVWSDLFDLHLEAAGDEHAWDKTVTRRFDQRSLIVIGLLDNRVRAFWALNAPDREFGPIRLFIQKQIDLAGSVGRLEDPEFNLADLFTG